jgi:fatty acid-binding protein DegV
MYRNGRIGERIKDVCDHLYLLPVISVNRGVMKCVSVMFGSEENAAKRYIRKQLKGKKKIDTRILFIAHAGISKKKQDMILKEIEKYVKFDNVVFQKVSATIASNCGLGSFGLLYHKNN